MADLENALTASIASDGQTATSASIPFANGLSVSTIAEKSANTGVTIDGVLLKDGRVDTAKGADIASATTTDIGAASGNYVDITGTTAITGLGTITAGRYRAVQFDGALTLTHNASSLILPGGANMTTAAGDTAGFVSLGSGNWKCLWYTRVDGTPVVSSAAGNGIAVSGSTVSVDPNNATDTAIAVGDEILFADASDSNNVKKDTVQGLADLVTPPDMIGGLKTSNGTDADHDIDIAAGAARDATDAATLTLSSAITKQIDASWSVGSAAGGLDTGTVAINTSYAVWLIKRSDTGVVDALFSASFTAPTMPASYDYKRLIGWVVTDGSANIIAFTQSGDYFRLTGDVLSDVADATITADTFETATLKVPPHCIAHVYAGLTSTSDPGDARMHIRTKGAADAATVAEAWAASANVSGTDRAFASGGVLVDSNSQIEYAADENSNTVTVYVSTFACTMLTRSAP